MCGWSTFAENGDVFGCESVSGETNAAFFMLVLVAVIEVTTTKTVPEVYQ